MSVEISFMSNFVRGATTFFGTCCAERAWFGTAGEGVGTTVWGIHGNIDRGFSRASLAQVRVGARHPVGAGRIEDIEVYRVFHRFGFVRHVGGDGQNFAGLDYDFFVVDPESERAFQNVSELLVGVAVLGDNTTLLQKNAGEH